MLLINPLSLPCFIYRLQKKINKNVMKNRIAISVNNTKYKITTFDMNLFATFTHSCIKKKYCPPQ